MKTEYNKTLEDKIEDMIVLVLVYGIIIGWIGLIIYGLVELFNADIATQMRALIAGFIMYIIVMAITASEGK
tara:strand:- start:408 stop:623 length:216 start_codon:yes stop_codon:yes gene_type:complete